MNFDEFFSDVSVWINVCNKKAKEFGMESSEFWTWVADTLARLCEKYDNHELALAQSHLLWDWLNG